MIMVLNMIFYLILLNQSAIYLNLILTSSIFQLRSDQIRLDDWVEVIAFTTAPPIFSINVGSSLNVAFAV